MDNISTPPPQSSLFSKRMTIVAALYIAFLVTLIVLADKGILRVWLLKLQTFPYFDKIGHFLLLGTASLFVNLALRCRQFKIGSRPFLLGSAIVAVLITLEECSQIFFVFRGFEWSDMFSNWLGIFVFGQIALRLSPPPQQEESV